MECFRRQQSSTRLLSFPSSGRTVSTSIRSNRAGVPPQLSHVHAGPENGRWLESLCSINDVHPLSRARYPRTLWKLSTAISTGIIHSQGLHAVDGNRSRVSTGGGSQMSIPAIHSSRSRRALCRPESGSLQESSQPAKTNVRSRKFSGNRHNRASNARGRGAPTHPGDVRRRCLSQSNHRPFVQAPSDLHTDSDYPQRPIYLCNPRPAVIHKLIHRRFPHVVRTRGARRTLTVPHPIP